MAQSSIAKLDRIGVGSVEAQIHQRVQDFMAACESGNRDLIQSFYSVDVVAYDCPPKLRFTGRDQYMKSWDKWFLSQFEFPVRYERQEERIRADGDLAVVNSILHFQGRYIGVESETAAWLRQTLVFARIADEWRIVHEHISVPVAEDGSALLNLNPEMDNAAGI